MRHINVVHKIKLTYLMSCALCTESLGKEEMKACKLYQLIIEFTKVSIAHATFNSLKL